MTGLKVPHDVPKAIDERLVETGVEDGVEPEVREKGGVEPEVGVEGGAGLTFYLLQRMQTIRRSIGAVIPLEVPEGGFTYENLEGKSLPVAPNMNMRGLQSDEPINVSNSDLCKNEV